MMDLQLLDLISFEDKTPVPKVQQATQKLSQKSLTYIHYFPIELPPWHSKEAAREAVKEEDEAAATTVNDVKIAETPRLNTVPGIVTSVDTQSPDPTAPFSRDVSPITTSTEYCTACTSVTSPSDTSNKPAIAKLSSDANQNSFEYLIKSWQLHENLQSLGISITGVYREIMLAARREDSVVVNTPYECLQTWAAVTFAIDLALQTAKGVHPNAIRKPCVVILAPDDGHAAQLSLLIRSVTHVKHELQLKLLLLHLMLKKRKQQRLWRIHGADMIIATPDRLVAFEKTEGPIIWNSRTLLVITEAGEVLSRNHMRSVDRIMSSFHDVDLTRNKRQMIITGFYVTWQTIDRVQRVCLRNQPWCAVDAGVTEHVTELIDVSFIEASYKLRDRVKVFQQLYSDLQAKNQLGPVVVYTSPNRINTLVLALTKFLPERDIVALHACRGSTDLLLRIKKTDNLVLVLTQPPAFGMRFARIPLVVQFDVPADNRGEPALNIWRAQAMRTVRVHDYMRRDDSQVPLLLPGFRYSDSDRGRCITFVDVRRNADWQASKYFREVLIAGGQAVPKFLSY